MMNPQAEAYQRDIPTKPYDLLREGLIVLLLIAIIVFALALFFGSPDYPTVRGEDVAQLQPIAYLKTSANILAGNSSVDKYGPPYTSDTANSQRILGIAPANWFGVTNPINPTQDFILKPLARVAILRQDVADALSTYESATADQQQAWLTAYLDALDSASVTNNQVSLPDGDYGPIDTLMTGMLDLGRAGLLEGALESNTRLPFTLDFTRSLLFFQDDVDASVADTLDMAGDQWGISHETGSYPGAWWLWPYTVLYQIKPIADSANADLLAGVLMLLLVLVLLLIPFIPILNQVPRWLRVHRIIWRDWYTRNT
jgi:hypothetical protein